MIKIVRSSSTNAEVTDYYLDVIAKIVESCGEQKYEDDVKLDVVRHFKCKLILQII